MPVWQELLNAVHDQQPVGGSTHNFYRYPARFAPSFARQMILSFTRPGDLVLDPFMGGATTLVEATSLGRRVVGTDISSLAVFLARTKTSVMSAQSLNRVRRWANQLLPKLNLHNPRVRADKTWTDGGYQRNISSRNTWPTRKLLELALATVSDLDHITEQQFARCVLLRTAQWALDCRAEIPSASEIRAQLMLFLDEMTHGSREFANEVRRNYRGVPEPVYLHRSAIGIELEPAIRNLGSPSLILTSPPYPGVHVLYHRWQVQGRRETPAPFWIADTLDGAGASFYTFGSRQNLPRYYEQMRKAFSSVAKLATRKTLFAQMVAFSAPESQLPAYLKVMQEVGLSERLFPQLANHVDGRIWRRVPNRKWYANNGGATGGSEEVVLFHKLA